MTDRQGQVATSAPGVEAVCVSGTDLPSVPGRKPRPHRDRQAAGDRPRRRPPARSGRRRPGQPQAPRRRGAGGLRLRPGGRRLLGRRARTATCRRAGSARTCAPPGWTCATPLLGERWRVGTALFEVTAWRTPVRELRPLLGRPRPGQAVRRARRHRRLPAGARDRRDRCRRRGRGRVPPRPRDHRGDGLPDRHDPEVAGCPSSPRRCTYLPVKDQPKLRAKIDARAAAGV